MTAQTRNSLSVDAAAEMMHTMIISHMSDVFYVEGRPDEQPLNH